MELSEGIRKIGFRRWHERQLIVSHLYLVTWFLSFIGVLACLEGFSFRAPGWEPVLRLAAMIGGLAVCVWSLRRYFAALGFAVHAANCSICAKCTAYGQLELTGRRDLRAPAPVERDAGAVPSVVAVRCRRCGNEWIIE
jgi:ribosomal protein L40E